jgi:hypothetical protein
VTGFLELFGFLADHVLTWLVGALFLGVVGVLGYFLFASIEELKTSADCLAWLIVYLVFIYLIGILVRAGLGI